MHPEKEILPGLDIRPMVVGDLEEALKIEKASFPNPWSYGQFESELKNPVSSALVVSAPFEGSEALAGYIIYWTVHGEAHILNIAVNPLLRRRGIATFLLRESLSRMRRTLVFEVFLEVRKSNAVARALYRRFGFTEAFERKNYYGDEDAIVMTLVF